MKPGDPITYTKRKKRGAKRKGYKTKRLQGVFRGYEGDKVLIENKAGRVYPFLLEHVVGIEFEI